VITEKHLLDSHITVLQQEARLHYYIRQYVKDLLNSSFSSVLLPLWWFNYLTHSLHGAESFLRADGHSVNKIVHDDVSDIWKIWSISSFQPCTSPPHWNFLATVLPVPILLYWSGYNIYLYLACMHYATVGWNDHTQAELNWQLMIKFSSYFLLPMAQHLQR